MASLVVVSAVSCQTLGRSDRDRGRAALGARSVMMSRLGAVASASALIVLAATAWGGGGAGRSGAGNLVSACVPAWRVVRTPFVGRGALNAVAARSPGDAWAVGESSRNPLIEHWGGSKWSV